MTNKIWTVTGPSCSGKTTLVRQLLDTGVFCEVLSFTSRQRRTGEQENVDYNFLTVDQSKKLIDDGEVAESINFRGNYYGITNEEINFKLASGKIPIVIVEPNGLQQLRNKYNCASIYIDSTLLTLYKRFLTRFAQSHSADVDYEAKRLMSIGDELIEWRNKFPPNMWSVYLQEFGVHNEKDVVNSIVQHAFSQQ